MAKEKRHKKEKGSKLVTGKCRLSYPHLFVPRAFQEGGDEMYEGTFIIDPSWDTFKKVDKDGMEVLKKLEDGSSRTYTDLEWYYLIANTIRHRAFPGVNFGTVYKDTVLKSPIKAGNDRDDVEDRPEYQNVYYLTARGYIKPTCILQNKAPAGADDLYPGCYVRATLYPESYHNGGNAGVKFRLGNVQKWEDGERLGTEHSNAQDDFDSIGPVGEFDSGIDEGSPFDGPELNF